MRGLVTCKSPTTNTQSTLGYATFGIGKVATVVTVLLYYCIPSYDTCYQVPVLATVQPKCVILITSTSTHQAG